MVLCLSLSLSLGLCVAFKSLQPNHGLLLLTTAKSCVTCQLCGGCGCAALIFSWCFLTWGQPQHPFSVSYFSNQKTVLTPGPQQLYCNRYILTPIPSTLNLSCPHPHPLFLDNLYTHSKLPERAFMVGGLDFKSSGVQRPNGSIPSFRRSFFDLCSVRARVNRALQPSAQSLCC